MANDMMLGFKLIKHEVLFPFNLPHVQNRLGSVIFETFFPR